MTMPNLWPFQQSLGWSISNSGYIKDPDIIQSRQRLISIFGKVY